MKLPPVSRRLYAPHCVTHYWGCECREDAAAKMVDALNKIYDMAKNGVINQHQLVAWLDETFQENGTTR